MHISTPQNMKEIKPTEALYIKLGREGQWEKECIKEKQTLRFGYIEVSHRDCLAGRWSKIAKQVENFIRSEGDKGAITRDVNQIAYFYGANENVLWITFYKGYMWWCFSRPEITQHKDRTKTRPVKGKWSNTDINGQPLTTERLRGSLVSVQGFQGTICKVKEFEYVVQKINSKVPIRVEQTQQAYKELIDKVEQLVKGLTWRDFEVLVDLIFREAGWKRLSRIGEDQKTVDLELMSPITNEKVAVQVKSAADLKSYKDYTRRLSDMDFARAYFVVHSPHKNLLSLSSSERELKIWGPHDVAKMCVDYGLVQWVTAKGE